MVLLWLGQASAQTPTPLPEIPSGRGTVYIAYAKRQASVGVSHSLMAPTMADPRAAIAAGADPLSLAGNLALPQSGKPEESNPLRFQALRE